MAWEIIVTPRVNNGTMGVRADRGIDFAWEDSGGTRTVAARGKNVVWEFIVAWEIDASLRAIIGPKVADGGMLFALEIRGTQRIVAARGNCMACGISVNERISAAGEKDGA